MALVRELVTLVTFKSEGLDKVNSQVTQLKTSLMGLGKLFGIYLAADKIYEVVDGLVSAGKEINKLQYQMARLARPSDDIRQANQDLFDIAQKTGVKYTEILSTYREWLNESKDSKVSQEALLKTTENMYKAFAVGKVNPEQVQAVLGAFNQGFRRGAIGLRQWGLIVDEAPDLVDSFAKGVKYAGKTGREALQEMAKDGKLTADVITGYLGKSIEQLDKDFAKLPITTTRAWNYVWNRFAKLSSEIWKVGNQTEKVGRIIVKVGDTIYNTVEKIINVFGGLGNAIQFIGIAAGAAIGIKLVTALAFGTRAVALFALKWTALAAAIVLVVDAILWMAGEDSVIGRWVGKFEDVMAAMEQKVLTSPFADWYISGREAIQWIQQKLRELGFDLNELTIAIGLVGAAFFLWNLIGFGGLLSGLRLVLSTLNLIRSAIGLGAIAGATAPWWLRFAAKLGLWGTVGSLKGDTPGNLPVQSDEEMKRVRDEINKKQGYTGDLGHDVWQMLKNLGAGTVNRVLKGPEAIQPYKVQPGQFGPGTFLPGPGATLNNTPTVNQNNTLTFNLPQSEQALISQIRSGIDDVLGTLSRQAANAMPLTETARG